MSRCIATFIFFLRYCNIHFFETLQHLFSVHHLNLEGCEMQPTGGPTLCPIAIAGCTFLSNVHCGVQYSFFLSSSVRFFYLTISLYKEAEMLAPQPIHVASYLCAVRFCFFPLYTVRLVSALCSHAWFHTFAPFDPVLRSPAVRSH